MQNELKETVSTYITKYIATFERKLGLTEDDLMNDIREQVWKGLATHDPTKRANLKTYLNTLIKNRFGVLYKKSTIKKHNTVDYFADVYASAEIPTEHTVTEENGLTLLERREHIMGQLLHLNEREQLVYGGLLQGYSIAEMVDAFHVAQFEVIAIINKIAYLLKG